MKPVVMKQHIQGNRLNNNKGEKIKIASDKKKNISHLVVFLQFYSFRIPAVKMLHRENVESALVIISLQKDSVDNF